MNKPEENNPLDEEKIIIRKSISAPINSDNIKDNSVNTKNFTVQRINININKEQTLINIEKLDYFDSNKFLSKKRHEKLK